MNFIGTNVDIAIDTGVDITTATGLNLRCRQPDGTIVEFTPVAETTYAVYQTTTTDITVAGTYEFQVEFVLDGDFLKSDIVQIRFNDSI